MPSLSTLKKEVGTQNKSLDGLTDELVAAMVNYQNEYERLLRREKFDLGDSGNLKRTQKNFNRAQNLDPLNKLGFGKLAADHIDEYPSVAKSRIAFNTTIGIGADLEFRDFSLVKTFQNVDLAGMMANGRNIDAAIKRELVNAISLQQNYQITVDNLTEAFLGAGDKLGQAANYADSVMRTSLFGLTRSIDKQTYDSIGETEFVYVGPLDKRTREFCRARIGKIFDTEQIEKFGSQNGSGLPGFFSPGGFRCRHDMIGSKALQDI